MIKLIKGYPYDNTYDYIKLHANKTEQENYFNTFDHIFVDEGEEEGYIKSVQGKGTFVAPKNMELVREQANKDIENYILKIIEISNKFNISKEEILDLFEYIYGSDSE